MRILSLIPARGGSRRLPGKNILPLGGKPLIAWSIDASKGVESICDILVSTDEEAIAEIAKVNGALVPWLRPDYLATDTSSSIDVAIHALDWYENEKGIVDGLLLLQPTSPFRTKETILNGIALFQKNSRRPVVGVRLSHSHPMWSFKMEGGHLVPFMPENGLEKRSQDLPDAYEVSGSFYLISPENLRTERTFFGISSIPLIIESRKESLDIDTLEDFKLAEYYVNENVSSS